MYLIIFRLLRSSKISYHAIAQDGLQVADCRLEDVKNVKCNF